MLTHKGPLHTALSELLRVTDTRSPIPALTHIHFAAVANKVTLTATDLVTWLRATIPCEGNLAPCLLPPGALRDFIKPAGKADRETPVEFKVVADQIVVTIDGALTTLTTLPAADFPALPSDKAGAWEKPTTWPVTEFAKLGWVVLAAGSDPVRPQLTGVYLGEREAVATDGHRLHLATMRGLSRGPALIPATAIAALMRLLPKTGIVSATRAKDLVRFTTGTWALEVAVLDQVFPPYGQVIPADNTESCHAVVGVERMVAALAKLPRRGAGGLRMTINGMIKLEVENDAGTASTTVPVIETSHDGADLVIAFDAGYLRDALACSGAAQFTARFTDALGPVRLDVGHDQVAVVMPMRL